MPIIYSTDLYHPYDDADDQFDTATLFAMKEFDIRCIVLDNGRGRQIENPAKVEFKQRMGRAPLEQLMHITSRKVKFEPGLPQPLKNATDKALEQPKQNQAAIDMVIAALRESKEKVTLFCNGSCRDFAVVFNREPELFQQKVKAIYCNAGSVLEKADIKQVDFNVELDPWAYFRLFETGVPFYWCGTRPKMSERAPGGIYSTSFWIHQQRIIRAGTLPVQNYFVYALTTSTAEPIQFLNSGFQRIPLGRAFAGDGGRFMWCTAPFCHAAGRSIYRKGIADFVALQPELAEKAGIANQKIELFDFVPVKVVPKDSPIMQTLDFKNVSKDSKIVAFHRPVSDTDYRNVMESVLTNIIAELGQSEQK